MPDAFTRHRAALALRYDELPPELQPREIATLYEPDRREFGAVVSFIERAVATGTLPARDHVVTIEHYERVIENEWLRTITIKRLMGYKPDTLPPWMRKKDPAPKSCDYVVGHSTEKLRLIAAADFAAWPDRPPPKPGALVWAWLELAASAPSPAESKYPHRTDAADAAAKLWKDDPTITIADMIRRDEITIACDGKIYDERTLRNWIKDLCPNRKPGRRPKKPPAENSTRT